MNCHGNNKGSDNHAEHNQQNGMKHMLMMAMCCGLPIILVLILPFLGVLGSGFKSSIASIIPFLCPLMMILMIPMMLKSTKEGKSCCDDRKEETKE